MSAPTPEPAPASKPRSRKSGCLLLVAIGVALLAFGFWQMGEPGRRAAAAHGAIQIGSSLLEVEKLELGRHLATFHTERDGEWKSLPRDAFAALLAPGAPAAPARTRLVLTFLGLGPGRATFIIEADGAGRVTSIGPVKGWD